MAKMKGNSARKKTTISAVMGTADFLDGMRDAANGRPHKDHWDARTTKGVGSEQWGYERGRLFYAWIKSRGLDGLQMKEGRRVMQWAQDEFMAAWREKAII